MDAAAQYRQLLQLGRDEFLAAAAPAALVRYRLEADAEVQSALHTLTLDDDATFDAAIEETRPIGRQSPPDVDFELYPLAKKAGASFPDRITIGRTSNNDVVIADSSVSRLHAYVRRTTGGWIVADAGSKNGSWLRGTPLDARREQPLASRTLLRLGDVDLTFYSAGDLFDALGGA